MEEYFKIIKFIYKDVDQEALEFGIHFAIIVLAVLATITFSIIIISMWRIFKKAGQKPWKAIIPVYNLIILYKISGISPLFLLCIIFLFIPEISFIGFIIWNIVDATQKAMLCRKFNKSIWFIVGIILFDFVFYPILAFGNSKYIESKSSKTLN